MMMSNHDKSLLLHNKKKLPYMHMRRAQLFASSFMWLYQEIYSAEASVDNFWEKHYSSNTIFPCDNIIDIYFGTGKYTYDLNPNHIFASLCDQLEKMGHLTPLLGFFFLYELGSNSLRHFIDHLDSKSQEIIDNFLNWCVSKKKTTPFNDDVDLLLREEYIGKMLIRCYQPDDDVRTTEPDYDRIQQYVEKTLADKEPIVIAAWLAPIAATNPITAGKLLTKYILPALTNTRFDQPNISFDTKADDKQRIVIRKVIYKSIVRDCLYAIHLCISAPDSLSLNVHQSTKTVIDHYRDTDTPLHKLFRTPVKGLGDTLHAFLSSCRVDRSEANSDAEDRAVGFAELFDFFSSLQTSPSSLQRDPIPLQMSPFFNSLVFVAAELLLAEDNINGGIDVLLDAYHDNGHSRRVIKDMSYTRFLLIFLFYHCKDFDRKSRLYQTIRQEKERLTLRFKGEIQEFADDMMQDFEKEMYQATLDMVKEKYGDFTTTKTISDEEIERKLSEELKDLSPEEKKERILQYKIDKLEEITADMTSKTASFFTAKRVAYAKELEQSAATFLNQHPLKRGLYDSLADAVKRRIKNGLLESGVLFELNTILHEEDRENGAQGDNDRDYSAVILPMTKALELLGNLIFQGAIEDADLTQMSNAEKQKLKYFIKNGDWSDSLTLGNVAYMFKLEEFEGNPNYLPNLFKVIDETKLPTLQGIDLGYQNLPLSKSGPMIDAKFTDNTDPNSVITNYNLKVLSVILQYITDEFRNKCAHKDKIGIAEYEQCKDLLVTGKHLIWILLYLLKDDIQLGAESSETNNN